MILQEWQLWALATSFFTAFYIHVNHNQKICGLTLVLLRGLFMVVLLTPVALMLPAPQDPKFYALGFVVGLLVVWGDKHLLNAAAKHGGRLTSLFISLKIFFTFAAWSVLAPSGFWALVQQPWIGAGMLVCYAIMVASMLGLRKQDHTAAALLAVIPAAVLLGCSDILSKVGLGPHHGIAPLVYFMLAGQVACVLGSAVWLRKDLFSRPRHVFSKRHIKGTVYLLMPFVFLLVTYLSAISRAPNPAYVGAITVLTTVWLSLYYYLRQQESANWQSILALVAAAMGLTLLTA